MKIVKDLLLAMLNATLILVALCLFLLWQLSGTAKDIAASFGKNIQVIKPLGDEVNAVRSEIASLKSDLGAMANATGEQSQALRQDINSRLTVLNTKLDDMQASLRHLADTPDRLMAVAIDESATRLLDGVYALRGCTAPPARVTAQTPES